MNDITNETMGKFIFFSKEEEQLIGSLFQSEKGKRLLKIWEDRLLNTFVANPDENSQWAFFKEGQNHVLKSIAASVIVFMVEEQRKSKP